jgi:CheY-like chemotaxis protein
MASGLAKLFGLLGHEVQTAYDGPTAVEFALKHCPDVILLDIGLPGMSGYDVARQLRQESACRDALIVAITGYGQEEDIRKSKEAGFDHHLVKPIDYQALLNVIAR